MHHLIHAVVALAAFLVLFLLLMLSMFLYFAPTAYAFWRKHPHRIAIAVLNLFFGWTFAGWFVCGAWAYLGAKEKRNPESLFC